jgi:hypothetical protein
VVSLKNNALEQYRQGFYSNAKNVLNFLLHENIINPFKDKYDILLLANAKHMLCDFSGAKNMYEMLLHSGFETDLISEELRKLNNRIKDVNTAQIICEDKKMLEIITNLLPMFSRLAKPLQATIVESEKEYLSFCKDSLKISDDRIHKYSNFRSLCIFDDAQKHHIIFKADDLASCTHLQIVGMTSHEIAHLELTDLSIRQSFRYNKYFTKENTFINERLTDFYVISKGLAYELYQDRKGVEDRFGSFNYLVMDMHEIRNVVEAMSKT